MKKYTWILGGLMAMAITACTSDELMERPEQHPTEGEVVSVTAYVPGSNPDSRIAFTETEEKTDSYTLSWETSDQFSDQFSVIRDGQSNTFTKEAGTGNTFTGVLPGNSGEYYYAIYPAIAEGDADASAVPFDLSTQTGALDASKTYMRATSTDGRAFSFRHCMSILKASFSFPDLTGDATITQIKVTTPDAYKVNGTIDLSTGTLTVANGGTNIITISGNAITAPYYIYLPPMPASEEAKTFTIEVTAGDKTYKGTISRNDAIVAGKLYTATINLTEAYCYLPNVSIFREAVLNLVTYDTQAIRFIANSAETRTQIGTSSAYMKLSDDGTTLEIHTAAKEGFVFNADCSFMFSGLSEDNFFRALNSIDFNGCVNTANVTNMSYMFSGCTALTSLNLNDFNTEKVTNMSSMFYYCSSLNSLNLSSFNTEKVTNMSSMFYYCSYLYSLNLSSFNTANVTNMSSMFYNCSTLNSLNLSSFNTDNVTDMSYMFSECTALTLIDFNDRVNTANVTNMSNMFNNCSSLTSLDIQNFNIEKVNSIDYIFVNVGNTYQSQTGNKAKIIVTMDLCEALNGKSVSLGTNAEYFVIDEQPM